MSNSNKKGKKKRGYVENIAYQTAKGPIRTVVRGVAGDSKGAAYEAVATPVRIVKAVLGTNRDD